MASPLYTIEPYSPTINSSILPNISTSRTFSRPYAHAHTHPYTLLFTTTPPSPPASPTSTSNSASDRKGSRKHIARPPNAFLLFRSAFLKDARIPAHAEARQQNLSKVIGQCWNMMSLEERAAWNAKAEEVKQAHMARYPGYKFVPVPKVRAPPRRVSAAAGTPDEKAQKEKEREEATRKLREEFTEYKGEPVMSKRNSKKLARSVRGTERAARPSKKAAASTATPASGSASTSTSTSPSTFTSTSTSTPAATTSATTTTSPAAAFTTTSTCSTAAAASTPAPQPPARSLFTTLLSPLPIRAHLYPFAHLTPFLPSSTHLTPAPSAGPQITRITQSPPLTPFHPSDRQPQLQLQQIQQSQHIQLPQLGLSLGLCEPAAGSGQWDVYQERAALGMGVGIGDKFDAFNSLGGINVSVSQGSVYPAMGMSMGGNYASSNASAYFNGTRGGQASDMDLSVNMNMNVNMHQYLNLDDAEIDYSAFTNSYTCTPASVTPATPVAYNSPDAFCAFSPAASSSSSSSSSSMSPASALPASPVSNGSPASLAYPDSPITPVSGFLDSPITLVYPFPSPDPGSASELALTYPYPGDMYIHDHNNHSYDQHHHHQGTLIKFDENDNQLLRQTEFVDALERRYSSSAEGPELEGLSMGVHGAHDHAHDYDHAHADGARDEAALNGGAHGAYYSWPQQLGAGGLEVELGRMGYF